MARSFWVVLITLLLAACAAPAATTPNAPQEAASSTPMPTVTATIAPTATIVPTDTPQPTETPVPTITPTPDLESLEGFDVTEYTGFVSFNGQWQVHTIFAVPLESDETHHEYLRYLEIQRTDGSESWVVENQWLEYGADAARPVPYLWVDNANMLYYTHVIEQEGCIVPYHSGIDLYRADQTSKTSTQLLEHAYSFAPSPDDTLVIYGDGTTTIHIKNLLTGEIQDFEITSGVPGNFVWAPDQSSVLFVVGNYCDGEIQHAVWRVDPAFNRLGEIYKPSPNQVTIIEWAELNRVLVQDNLGVYWWMNPLTGVIKLRE